MKSNFKSQHRRTGVPPVARPRAGTGFTLIELLVVISIIAVIAGIGVAVSGSMYRSAQESRTRNMLGQLMGAATEYKEQVGKHVTFAVNAATYDGTDPYDDDARSINTFVSNVRLNAKPAFEQLRTVDGRSIAGADSSFENGAFDTGVTSSDHNSVVDAFENFVRYYPGSDNVAGAVANADLIGKGMPKRKQPYFASAGQDGLWGTFDTANEPDDDAKDNLFSF